jgi:putative ABC transport system permease protein
VGLYGVLATSVRQRTAELGVRIALGASTASVFRLVIGEGLTLGALGVALGLAVAMIATRVMRSILVGVGATDTGTFATVVLLFLTVVALASWIPARRAAGLDPVQALRGD